MLDDPLYTSSPKHAATNKAKETEKFEEVKGQEPEVSGRREVIEIDDSDFDIDEYEIEEKYSSAARKIQRQARVMLARNNFRVALYKLILLKNIVDTKVHKERI